MSPKGLLALIDLQNKILWDYFTENKMACIECPIYGFVDADFEDCANCTRCPRGK